MEDSKLIGKYWKQIPKLLRYNMIKSLHEEGYSIRRISQMFNIPKSTVHYYLKNNSTINLHNAISTSEIVLDVLRNLLDTFPQKQTGLLKGHNKSPHPLSQDEVSTNSIIKI